MKLDELKAMVSNPVYYNRIYCTTHSEGFYIIVSIKSLRAEGVDDKIMD